MLDGLQVALWVWRPFKRLHYLLTVHISLLRAYIMRASSPPSALVQTIYGVQHTAHLCCTPHVSERNGRKSAQVRR